MVSLFLTRSNQMKIFCIGRNYANHAKEMNSPVPSQPMVFMKPPTALLKNNEDFYYPDFTENLHYEVELVLKIAKNGKRVDSPFALSYIESVGLGIDFTARDVQAKCKEKGHPWEIAKAFDNSAVVSPFVSMDDITDDEGNVSFSLYKNDELVQQGNTKDLIFNYTELIVHISKFFSLQKGDLIYTGTPAGVGPVVIGDVLTGFIGEREMFRCEVK